MANKRTLLRLYIKINFYSEQRFTKKKVAKGMYVISIVMSFFIPTIDIVHSFVLFTFGEFSSHHVSFL